MSECRIYGKNQRNIVALLLSKKEGEVLTYAQLAKELGIDRVRVYHALHTLIQEKLVIKGTRFKRDAYGNRHRFYVFCHAFRKANFEKLERDRKISEHLFRVQQDKNVMEINGRIPFRLDEVIKMGKARRLVEFRRDRRL